MHYRRMGTYNPWARLPDMDADHIDVAVIYPTDELPLTVTPDAGFAAARALVTRPDIVFADEPSGNLDSKAEAELLAFMRRAVDEFSQTIVMVTHDPIAASYADRIVFLDDGDTVDEMVDPTVDSILEKMKHLGE